MYTEYTDLKVAGSPHSIRAYYQGDGSHNISDSSGSPISQPITAKPLTYSGLTADPTIYDGTTTAKLGGAATLQAAEPPGTGTTADGIPYTADSVSAGGAASGTLAAKDVGNQAVTITGVTLTGIGTGNYTLTRQTGLVQTVTAKALTVVGLAVTNKLADGTTTAGFTTNSVAQLQAREAGGTGTTTDGKAYTAPYAFNLNAPSSHNLTLNGGGAFVFAGNLYDDPANAILTFNGTGSYTLAAANYVTKYTLNSGTLNLGNTAAVRGTVILNGGTVYNTGIASLTTSPSFNWNGDFSFDGSDLNLGVGAVTLGGNRTVTVNGATVTVGGAIGDGGAGYSLTKAGTGTLSLKGATTYKGNTTVAGGTLVLTNATLATNSTVTVAVTAGAVLELDFAVTNTVGRLVLDGTAQPAGVYGSSSITPGFTGTGSLLVLGLTAPTSNQYHLLGQQRSVDLEPARRPRLESAVQFGQRGRSQLLAHSHWGYPPPFTVTISPVTPRVFYRLVYP